MRKMISFKIENLPENDRKIVDAWADGQKSIQQSLANLVMHVVGYVGNADVMEFEIQRKLHTIFAAHEVLNVIDPKPQQAKAIQAQEQKEDQGDQGDEYEEDYPSADELKHGGSKLFDE